MKKEYKLILMLFILAFLIRILFISAVPIKLWDEAVYANLGYDLSKNPPNYSFQNWEDLVLDNSWPKAGFRPPLLPYILALFYFLGLNYLIDFIIPLIGATTIVLVYFLGRKLFNKKVGLISAILLALTPTHAYLSSKILNDPLVTFFITLALLFFWKGFEENSNRYKILFGVVMALALLSKYTTLWVFPVFLIYFLIRDRSFKFLKDKYLWYSILAFFIVLIPWFIYGFFEYNNPLGAFIHGFISSSFWGGKQPWFFFILKSPIMLSVLFILFPISIYYLIRKKLFLKKQVYFLLILIIFFLIIASCMPHKEDRFILPIIPAICLLCGLFLTKIELKNKNLVILFLILAIPLMILPPIISNYFLSIDKDNSLYKTSEFLINSDIQCVISEAPPLVYYYTKKESYLFPDNLNSSILKEGIKNKKTVFLFANFEHQTNNEIIPEIKQKLNQEAKLIFSRKDLIYIYELD
jgi:4-amino-4-deoxy-L-arabinose transferase-like glycosyltransferase